MRHGSDEYHCKKNQPDREHQDRTQIAAKIAPGSENCRRIKQRWEKEEEDQIRIEPDDREPRDEAQRQSAKDEQDRIRPHIRIFVNGAQVRDLSQPLRATDEVVIVQALSGG